MKYVIFVKAPINLYKTYYQNERRGEKVIRAESKEEMLNKVNELKANGVRINSVRDYLGNWVRV